VLCCNVRDAHFFPKSVAAIVIIHSLQTTPDGVEDVTLMSGWLGPGGYLVACDVDNRVDLVGGTPSVLAKTRKRFGTRNVAQLLGRAHVTRLENPALAQVQPCLRRSLGDALELTRVFESAGLKPEQIYSTGRGYTDFVIYRKPNSGGDSE